MEDRQTAAAVGPNGAGALPSVALALQGGGSHGAFTWGVLDRLLEEVARGRLHIAAISGASAGGINATLCACGLALGGAEAARGKLRTFWEAVSRGGALAGNPLFGFAEPGPFGGWNIDWSPVAIALEAVGLVISPYNNPFYRDALRPLLEEVLPPAELAAFNQAEGAVRVFVSATNVRDNQRTIFTQPALSIDALRASACLPTEFRAVKIDGVPYWDGGYLGNPPLSPLVDVAQDLILVMVNPLVRQHMPPRNARDIQDRLNEIGFNTSVVLEINAIEAVNRVLADLDAANATKPTKYKTVRFHLIRDDRFLAEFGFVSKSSTSWALIDKLFERGRAVADRWLASSHVQLGRAASCDVHAELVKPVLGAGGVAHAPADAR
ncbi:patatin-like phospholipase family protein [Paraburkholderia sp. IMGN_8]|uniref:patatin-like phospholipase family protein n=1 Tax=Paraburkholderia sp. IMGN_8 TaxID=3136564 RepID=UPI003100C986